MAFLGDDAGIDHRLYFELHRAYAILQSNCTVEDVERRWSGFSVTKGRRPYRQPTGERDQYHNESTKIYNSYLPNKRLLSKLPLETVRTPACPAGRTCWPRSSFAFALRRLPGRLIDRLLDRDPKFTAFVRVTSFKGWTTAGDLSQCWCSWGKRSQLEVGQPYQS